MEREPLDSMGDHPWNLLVVLCHILRGDKMRLGEPAIVMLGMSMFACVTYTVKIIANAVVKHREADRRIAELASAPVSDVRLARLESAVDAIAIEVERISEGQRFTTRLLSEQNQAPRMSLPAPGKFDTPH
jgi:hypothetical protein